MSNSEWRCSCNNTNMGLIRYCKSCGKEIPMNLLKIVCAEEYFSINKIIKSEDQPRVEARIHKENLILRKMDISIAIVTILILIIGMAILHDYDRLTDQYSEKTQLIISQKVLKSVKNGINNSEEIIELKFKSAQNAVLLLSGRNINFMNKVNKKISAYDKRISCSLNSLIIKNNIEKDIFYKRMKSLEIRRKFNELASKWD